jgi:hypothetical protein
VKLVYFDVLEKHVASIFKGTQFGTGTPSSVWKEKMCQIYRMASRIVVRATERAERIRLVMNKYQLRVAKGADDHILVTPTVNI